MNKKITIKLLLASTVFAGISMNGAAQNCDQYLNQQTKTVNTKAVIVKVLGKTVDGLLGTSFSKLNTSFDQLLQLDILQYQLCMQWEKVKTEASKEKLESQKDGTLATMAALLSQSGVLPPEVNNQLKTMGIVQQTTNTILDTTPAATTPAATTAAEVTVPTIQPAVTNTTTGITFPCRETGTAGVIQASAQEVSMDPQIAKQVAKIIALEELASKIEVSVKSTVGFFCDRTNTNMTEAVRTAYGQKIDVLVDRTIQGYKIGCEEYTQNQQTQKYTCYLRLEIDEAKILTPIYNTLQQTPELQNALPNAEQFTKAVNQNLQFVENVGLL